MSSSGKEEASAVEPLAEPCAIKVPSDGLDRRRFVASLAGLGAAGLGVAGLGGLNNSCAQAEGEKPARTEADDSPPRVVRLERPSVMKEVDRISEETAGRLIDDLLAPLGGEGGAVGFLKRRFKPVERIGIKLNCLAGRGLSTRPELVYALIERLIESGIEAERIIVFERTRRELKRAGFSEPPARAAGIRILGHDSPGAGYEAEPTCFESIGSCFCNILTRGIDALINFGVLKDHDLAGISIGLKNLYGLIHNPNKYHDNGCSPYVAHVAAAPPVRDKLRLTLCDGLTAQYQGGPALNGACTWPAGIMLASTDPVALDAVGADIIERARTSKKLDTLAALKRFPSYLAEANRLGLGEHRLDKIRVVSIE